MIRNPFRNVVNNFKNFVRETINVIKHNQSAPKSDAPEVRVIKKHNPPWWRRIYGFKRRSEVDKVNLQPVRHFGTFAPVKPLYKPKWYKI